MTDTGLTMVSKDYYAQTYGKTVRGTLYQHDPSHVEYAADLIQDALPEDCVLIRSTVKLSNYFEIVMPHKDCKAEHEDPKPVWWTGITARVFAGVDKEHQKTVRLFGERSITVRVPIVKELTLDDFRGMA